LKNDPKGQTNQPLDFHPTEGPFAVQAQRRQLLDLDGGLEIESLPGLETDPSSKGKGKNVGRKPGDETLEEFRKLVGIGSGKDVEAGRPPRGLYHEILKRYNLLIKIDNIISSFLIISLLVQIIFAIVIITIAAILSTIILGFGIVNLILIGIVIVSRREREKNNRKWLEVRKVKEASEDIERTLEMRGDLSMNAQEEAEKISRMYQEALVTKDSVVYYKFSQRVNTQRDDPEAAYSEPTYNKPVGTTNKEGLRQSTMLAQDKTKKKKPETQFEMSPPSTVPQLKRTSTF
jgi:hypothetical protein